MAQTELKMADAFHAWLKIQSKSGYFAGLRAIQREIASSQGVPDFLTVRSADWKQLRRLVSEAFNDGAPFATAHVLASLSHRVYRTTQSVIERSPYSDRITTSSIRRLQRDRIIVTRKQDRLRLHDKLALASAELISFELKLNDWKRALYQALQSKAYSDIAYCVFPAHKRNTILRNAHVFRFMNVGVILFDAERGRASIVVRARKEAGPITAPYVLALARVISAHKAAEKPVRKNRRNTHRLLPNNKRNGKKARS